MTATERLKDLVFPQGLYCNCCGKYIDETRTYGSVSYTHLFRHRDAQRPGKGLKKRDVREPSARLPFTYGFIAHAYHLRQLALSYPDVYKRQGLSFLRQPMGQRYPLTCRQA